MKYIALLVLSLKLIGLGVSFAGPEDFGFPRLGEIRSLDSSSHNDFDDDHDDDPYDDHDDDPDDDHDDIDDFDDMDDHD